MVIYADVLMALNGWVDCLLLEGTARLLHLPRHRWRMLGGTLLGAVGSLIVLWPSLPAPILVTAKLLTGALMLLATFRWQGAWLYIKTATVFFVLSAVFAGGAVGVYHFLRPDGFYILNGTVYYNLSPLVFVALTVICYAAVCLFDRAMRGRTTPGLRYRLLITASGKTVSLTAFHDTGNHLSDAFTGRPVLLVRRERVQELLPPGIEQFDFNGKEDNFTQQPSSNWRLIPFGSLGGEGLLPAFCPEKLTVTDWSGRHRDITGTYVAVCDTLRRQHADALIGNETAALFDGPLNERSKVT